jgi:circadian clock protein KaiC
LTTSTLRVVTSITETRISTITDTITSLRYVEKLGQVRIGLTVLKMRVSHHDKDIRGFTIDDHGLHTGEPFHSVFGILSEDIRHVTPSEFKEMEPLLLDESARSVPQRIGPTR